MFSGLDPGFHQCHRLIAVPVCIIFIENVDIIPFVKEIGIPCLATFLCVIVPGWPTQHHHIRIFWNLFHRTFCTHLSLSYRVCIHGTRPFHHRVIIASVQVTLMCGGVRSDYRNTCVYQIFHIRSLRSVVVRLYNHQIVLFCDTVFQQTIFCVVISFTADTGQFNVIIAFRSFLHLLGHPGCKSIRASSRHKADSLRVT